MLLKVFDLVAVGMLLCIRAGQRPLVARAQERARSGAAQAVLRLGRGGRASAFRAVVNGLLSREPKNTNKVMLRKLRFDLGAVDALLLSGPWSTASCRVSPRTRAK
jgi:hypothetical protein